MIFEVVNCEKNKRRNWTKDEIILALYEYNQIEYGKIHSTNKDIIKLAQKIGRTPSAVAMKILNLASYDLTLRKRNVSGLKNASKLDKIVWDEFEGRIGILCDEVERIGRECENEIYSLQYEYINEEFKQYVIRGEDVESIVKVRRNQAYFRRMVLTAYSNRCCISGVNIPELLIASHIKPWKDSDDHTEKVNPRNGLCLNALYDKAFDLGYITVDKMYKIHVSNKIKKKYNNELVSTLFYNLEYKSIEVPEKFTPDKRFLEYHNDVIFVK